MLTNRHNCLQSEALQRWQENNPGRVSAEACNMIATQTEASILALVMDGLKAEAPFMLCAFFEERSWPAKDLDTNWLDATGEIVWRAARVARGEAV